MTNTSTAISVMAQNGGEETMCVEIEPLTPSEEVDFLNEMHAAVDRGEMSREESQLWIKREYELMYP